MAGETPRLTKKPIPSTWKRWDREVRGIQKYLDKLPKMGDDMGDAWVGKQRAYYTARLQDLQNVQPIRPIRRTTKAPNRKSTKRGH